MTCSTPGCARLAEFWVVEDAKPKLALVICQVCGYTASKQENVQIRMLKRRG